MVTGTTAGEPVLLYDGDCGFCNRAVQTILRHDTRATLRFAALASPFGRSIVAARPELHGVDSMVWVEFTPTGAAAGTWVRSAAALRVARYLGGPWGVAGVVLALVPRPLRDAVYDWVARHRARAPGSAACLALTPEQQARFLDAGGNA